jgi:hypothetical protein
MLTIDIDIGNCKMQIEEYNFLSLFTQHWSLVGTGPKVLILSTNSFM